MKFLIINVLFCFYINLKNRNTYLIVKKRSGNDERYSIERNETEIKTQLVNFQQNYEKKQMLEFLQNDKISIHTKLEALKDNSIQAHNLKAGGLINDFD
jgi:dTDP-D-glucose 4,6-dehydratase